MTFPTFENETIQWRSDKHVIGIDEVGRGCFAGPLYVGAVVFPNNMQNDLIDQILQNKINDSKLVSEKRREKLAEYIKKTALICTVIGISVEDINSVGIGGAGKVGMEHAARQTLSKLGHLASNVHILTDAFKINAVEFPNQTPIIHGDRISISIAAASIIAKVARDRYMTELSKSFPKYEWHKNKGYGTTTHRNAIQSFGVTPHHRTAFVKTTLMKATC